MVQDEHPEHYGPGTVIDEEWAKLLGPDYEAQVLSHNGSEAQAEDPAEHLLNQSILEQAVEATDAVAEFLNRIEGVSTNPFGRSIILVRAWELLATLASLERNYPDAQVYPKSWAEVDRAVREGIAQDKLDDDGVELPKRFLDTEKVLKLSKHPGPWWRYVPSEWVAGGRNPWKQWCGMSSFDEDPENTGEKVEDFDPRTGARVEESDKGDGGVEKEGEEKGKAEEEDKDESAGE